MHSVTPGDAPHFFPPKAAQPGSVGDADYSPLVQFANAKNALFNMPMVAFNVSEDDLNKMCDGNVDYSKVEDKAVKICPRDGTVTFSRRSVTPSESRSFICRPKPTTQSSPRLKAQPTRPLSRTCRSRSRMPRPGRPPSASHVRQRADRH